jgi:DNA topoisomerase I
VPPAWTDVWICPWPQGHIQAVGTDSAGRRQYRYHDRWRIIRDVQKFEHVLEFGRSLPQLRAVVDQDLMLDGLARPRVLAGMVRLLDLGFFRVGGEEYAKEHETFGIATLLKEHVRLSRGQMIFDYPAKGSVQRVVRVSDEAAFELVRSLKNRRSGGDRLFAYKQRTRWCNVRSEEVNEYIREAAGGDYTAKDFRTWSATVLAATELATIGEAAAASVTARKRAQARVVKKVAEYMGNTPAVCRRAYLDPKILDRFEGGDTIAPALGERGGVGNVEDPAVRAIIESAVVDLIADDRKATAVA